MTTIDEPATEQLETVFDWLTHPSRETTELYLIRHGQTAGNARNLMIGSTDMPLNDVGLHQAEELADRMRAIRIDALVSSPLLRARQTADAIAASTGHQVQVVRGLEEIDCGDGEGLTLEAIAEQFPDIAPLLDDLEDMTMAFPNGEGRLAFHDRVLGVITGILAQHAGLTVAVVCHGGVIASLLGRLHGGSGHDFATYGVSNCSISHLHVGPDGTRIRTMNDREHLTNPMTRRGD